VNIHYNQGDYATCVSLLEQWLQHHPDDARARETINTIRGVIAP
jgi:hypothetical protein